MRPALYRILPLILLASSALAQLPPLTERALSISAEVKQADQRDTPWRTDYGSYRKEFAHRRALAVSLKAVGNFEPGVVITWAFVGSNTAASNRFVVFGEGRKDAALSRTGELRFSVESPEFSGKDTLYRALGSRDREGVKPAGWAVMVWQRGALVKAIGSTPEMAEFAKKNGSGLDAKPKASPAAKR